MPSIRPPAARSRRYDLARNEGCDVSGARHHPGESQRHRHRESDPAVAVVAFEKISHPAVSVTGSAADWAGTPARLPPLASNLKNGLRARRAGGAW